MYPSLDTVIIVGVYSALKRFNLESIPLANFKYPVKKALDLHCSLIMCKDPKVGIF